MKNVKLFFLLFILLQTSCDKRDVNPYFAEVYPEILEEIDIECEEYDSEYFISAIINGEEFCKYDMEEDPFWFNVNTSFTTSSPTYNSNETNNAKKGAGLIFGRSGIHRQEYFTLSFPNFTLDENVYDFLDSLTSIEDHYIMSPSDVKIPEGATLAEEGLLKSSGGFKDGFIINLNSLDKYLETGGNRFHLSTIFGDQSDSYLRFNEVIKSTEEDGVYYYMDIEFECKLYHWEQYGYEGVWGHLEDGRIITKVKVEE